MVRLHDRSTILDESPRRPEARYRQRVELRTIQVLLRSVTVLRTVCLMMGLIGLTTVAGCEETGNYLPSPLREDFPYELKFQSAKVWEPEGFEINLKGVLHRIVLASVEPPAQDDPRRQVAIDMLRDLVGLANGRAVVQGRDRFQREIARVYASPRISKGDSNPSSRITPEQPKELDVGWQLIRLGLAKCSSIHPGGNEKYQEAEAAARAEKLGIWKAN